ncbi:unnamed protein product, partial [Rotaria sordida]
MKACVLLTILFIPNIVADCPDKEFRCVDYSGGKTGNNGRVWGSICTGTCWIWYLFSCVPCIDKSYYLGLCQQWFSRTTDIEHVRSAAYDWNR